jgi:hypothetical protein
MRLLTAARATLLLVGVLAFPISPLPAQEDFASISISRPLAPEYRIHADGTVTQRLCYNWSCGSQELLTLSTADMTEVARQMAVCSGTGLHDRLQRLRIGIWRMEVLAQKYQPLLAGDEAINTLDRGRKGRMDCIDNASNTTNSLHILHDLGLLPGWSVSEPEVRDLFSMSVHWTAVVVDRASSGVWAVDSWFRRNGQLPFVLPLADWVSDRTPWQPPLDALNPYPRYSSQLCGS